MKKKTGFPRAGAVVRAAKVGRTQKVGTRRGKLRGKITRKTLEGLMEHHPILDLAKRPLRGGGNQIEGGSKK